jgi:hypothetical protein
MSLLLVPYAKTVNIISDSMESSSRKSDKKFAKLSKVCYN